jgi:hypothetical protein
MAREHFDKLLHNLLISHDDHMDCVSCSEQFDCLAEQVAAGADIGALLPAVEAHLACCPDCREEFEALVCIIRAEDDGLTQLSENN